MMAAFGEQVSLARSIQAADPQLVLVLEARDERADLTRVANLLGLEVLLESDDDVEPDEEFVLRSKKPGNPLLGSCLHAICGDATAFDRLRNLWRVWRQDQTMPRGFSPLRDLFEHLKDVRAWAPQDRLKQVDWDDYLAGMIPGHRQLIEIELWYRQSASARNEAQRVVTELLGQAGGEVHSTAVIDQIGYHGLKCTVPPEIIVDLANGRFEAVDVARSANVMFLRVSAQAIRPAEAEFSQADPTTVELADPLPGSSPVVCLLDGLPAVNHPLLRDRVVVHDPDDLAANYTVGKRRHGTAMCSIAIWGDRADAGQTPASRTVLVRPILAPSEQTIDGGEELLAGELVPDLMRRVFREIFEPQGLAAPVAPQIAVASLSVGDPASPFETILSSWARMIDWLSYEYGVLVVVAAGNHPRLSLAPANSDDLTALTGDARRQEVLDAQQRQRNQRRLLAPAESINALTVGAIHRDASHGTPVGYVADPTDGLLSISPISGVGPGYRRSVKPELSANGGRTVFRSGVPSSDAITFSHGLGVGLRTALPESGREGFTAGTSAAAALVAREAGRLHDLIDEITDGMQLTRRQRAAAMKALLVHGCTDLDDFPKETPEYSLGYGAMGRDYSQGCAENEAILLFFGSLGAAEEQDLHLPLPDGLGVRETKQIEATLAWLSPINWRHRSYRRAALSFVAPGGSIPKLDTPVGLKSSATTRGAATVQHQVWQTKKAFAEGRGSDIVVKVKCLGQAGGLDGEAVDYAAALTLWVAPAVNVDVYSQVRDQIRARVIVQPT
jgi:Subtilase family